MSEKNLSGFLFPIYQINARSHKKQGTDEKNGYRLS